ncbi:S1/P1 nuclease [Lacipirellula sp.]|uniref:S1/P1 nuclease n=1 Tax=Lacipirellula sp. TaxID=2691419 RepID=UPI003D0CB92F
MNKMTLKQQAWAVLACWWIACVLPTKEACAWNALGHKVIADIAWQQLDDDQRHDIVAILRRHPRFDNDFARQLPADVDENRWIFQQAAVWPDLARGFRPEDRQVYDHPKWHYVNFPLSVGEARPLIGVNLASDYPTPLTAEK